MAEWTLYDVRESTHSEDVLAGSKNGTVNNSAASVCTASEWLNEL